MKVAPQKISSFSSVVDPQKIANRDYLPELIFTTSRSSGPGGQHVNKLETRVTLRFKPGNSYVLTEEEKEHLLKKWSTKLTNDGSFVVHSEKYRTQLRNKEDTITKFRQAIVKAFTVPKARKATKPSKASVRRRIEGKKKLSEKKNRRKPPELD
ncbi:MAG: aminoacyl-tRNA hydrolase [Roseivirga sp.]|nr:aminoacyl-tRNA hydrolase [Roseivirga sp.]